MSRTIFIPVFCSVLVLSSCFSSGSDTEETGTGETETGIEKTAYRVEVAPISSFGRDSVIEKVATIEPVDSVQVSSLVQGRVGAILVKAGDVVSE